MRTSHYPYTEEFYQLADKFGIVIFDEVPAVGLKFKENFNNITLNLHKNLLKELYDRDKNHPCVIMWSLANEPSSEFDESVPYFRYSIRSNKIIKRMKTILVVFKPLLTKKK